MSVIAIRKKIAQKMAKPLLPKRSPPPDWFRAEMQRIKAEMKKKLDGNA